MNDQDQEQQKEATPIQVIEPEPPVLDTVYIVREHAATSMIEFFNLEQAYEEGCPTPPEPEPVEPEPVEQPVPKIVEKQPSQIVDAARDSRISQQ